MSFSFVMYYKPDYQRRYGICQSCQQGIEAGSPIMLGTGFWHGNIIKKHLHYNCWLREVEARAKAWFFANSYEPIRMAPEKKAELNRLRARRYYIRKKGGDPDEVRLELLGMERQIASVKAG